MGNKVHFAENRDSIDGDILMAKMDRIAQRNFAISLAIQVFVYMVMDESPSLYNISELYNRFATKETDPL